MSAQGTISGRAPMQLPVRGVAFAVAAALAAALTIGAIELTGGTAREANVANVSSLDWTAHVPHPFGQVRTSQRGAHGMPVQRVYPDGFAGPIVEGVEEMPVQRLYPDGFAAAADGYTPIRSDLRRKFGR